jgi:hypothetical protein
MAEALEKSPSGDLAPFELAFNDTFFGHKKKNPDKSALFAKVMAGTKGHNRGEEIANAFDWNQFNGTIVDVSRIPQSRQMVLGLPCGGRGRCWACGDVHCQKIPKYKIDR